VLSNVAVVAVFAAFYNSQRIPQDYYCNEYLDGLVEIAKGFLKVLSSQQVDKTMVAAVKGE
jgi:hypothetical protein